MAKTKTTAKKKTPAKASKEIVKAAKKPTIKAATKKVVVKTKPAPAKAAKSSVKKIKSPKAKSPSKNKDGDAFDDDEIVLDDEIQLIDVNLDDDDDEIEILLPKKKEKKKIEKEKKTLRVFSNPITALATIAQANASKTNKKEAKGKFELEYVIGTSVPILFEFISTPSGLSEWFADDVNIRDGVFSFIWEGTEQQAKLLNFKENEFIRFQWLDKADNTYFEFRIEQDDLTGDVSLMVIDFAEDKHELETATRLWDSQINELMHVTGSY
jgi:uncharacterized protein YndB with AHSA1/START domain